MTDPASVVYLRDLWRETRCFWTWPFGHYWTRSAAGDKTCERCGTWRKW